MKDSRVGVLDVRAVRAVQGRVHKLLDNLFLFAFFPGGKTTNINPEKLSTSKFSNEVLST